MRIHLRDYVDAALRALGLGYEDEYRQVQDLLRGAEDHCDWLEQRISDLDLENAVLERALIDEQAKHDEVHEHANRVTSSVLDKLMEHRS